MAVRHARPALHALARWAAPAQRGIRRRSPAPSPCLHPLLLCSQGRPAAAGAPRAQRVLDRQVGRICFPSGSCTRAAAAAAAAAAAGGSSHASGGGVALRRCLVTAGWLLLRCLPLPTHMSFFRITTQGRLPSDGAAGVLCGWEPHHHRTGQAALLCTVSGRGSALQARRCWRRRCAPARRWAWAAQRSAVQRSGGRGQRSARLLPLTSCSLAARRPSLHRLTASSSPPPAAPQPIPCQLADP